MSNTVISVENLSKEYRLGLIGGATFREEFGCWWAKKLGKPDPYAKIGDVDHGNREGEYIWALKDVSFEVKEGEILGIIGRNGAGKSTLLKILSRIVAPTSGQIKIKGRVASLLEVGTGFHPELTGRENIYLNGAILGMTKAEISHKLDEIIAFSEIETYIDTPVKRYSSGMRVRLAFSVAAFLEPEILVIDEVLAVGDAAFQKKCLGKMQDVSSSGRTVLFVSHNMISIKSLCTRAILLDGGFKTVEGGPEIIVEEYLKSSSKFGELIPYLECNNNEGGGDEHIRLRKVTVLNKSGYVAAAHEIHDSIQIEMEYEIAKEYHKIIAAHFWFYDRYDNCLFITTDRLANLGNMDPQSRYVSSCTIPGDLLNDGTYYVDVIITTPETRHKHVWLKRALAFEVLEGTRDVSYFGQIPGYFRPKLPWESRRISA